MTKEEFRRLAQSGLLFLDGATGSNLQKQGMPVGVCPELWITEHEEIMSGLQKAYLEAGTNILYAPTFTANRIKLKEFDLEDRIEELNHKLVEISKRAADGKALVAGDLTMTGQQLKPMGPLDFEELIDIYKEQIRYITEAGADLLVVETMMSLQESRAALIAAKETCPDIPVMVTMTFESDGRSLFGTDAATAAIVLSSLGADAVGANCSTGPDQMAEVIRRMAKVTDIPIIAKPNAGLPSLDEKGQTVYDMGPEEFGADMELLLDAGAQILGGCCGTTPAHIAALRAELDALPQRTEAAPAAKLSTRTAPAVEKDDTFLRKLNAGEKVIAIELDSPRVADLSGYLDGARRLQAAGADLLTIADCPIAQARMDSSLVACRVHRELGMCALPHMTCRDRNLNATKALLLGLYAEGVREVLAITGDPIPTAERDEVKNVYQFNSRKLAQYIVSLAGEGREMPSAMTVLGALNLNARNFEVELRRAVEKLENGMSGFLTQPVLSAQAVENLRKARQTLGERAKILAGIMPVVSQRNAIFMENEINGIHVEEDIIQRFAGLDREQGEALGLEVSMQMAREALPYADGFYLMTPFNRVALMERLIARLKTELLDAEG